MPRLGTHGRLFALLGLFVMSLIACNKTDAGPGALGSANASAAGREAGKPSSRDAGSGKTTTASALARSLVAVAATSPGDAQPCERACGRVGDCLLETRDVGEFEAGRLEFECLDLCVHSPEDGGAHSAFLACEQRSSCGEILGCARSNWDALVATRTGPLVQGVTTGGSSCVDSCRWVISCIASGMPPGHATLEPVYEESMRSCEMQCESNPTDLEVYMRMAECMRTNCSHDLQSVCYGM